jgi:ribosomal protein L7Ae-like RNA K-turn-binding protein
MLGFAQRARKLTLGMDATLQALRRNKAYAIIISEDLAENARKKITLALEQGNVPHYVCGSKAAFARALARNEVGIIGILDDSFAKSISNILNEPGSDSPAEAGNPKAN